MTQPPDTGSARHYWLAVASANHVALGREQGFMQVCHGKPAPLRRIHAGDGVVYYSPTTTFGQKDTLQAFTAAGVVTSKTPYQAQMGEHFFPWRHDVRWYVTTPVPIAPLRTQLGLFIALWAGQNQPARLCPYPIAHASIFHAGKHTAVIPCCNTRHCLSRPPLL